MATNNMVAVFLAFDNAYQQALTIPLDVCMKFAVFPLPWLSYLSFTVCGREGHISDSPDGQEIKYRPIGSPVVLPGIYYYVAEGESYFGILGPLSPLMLDPLWLDAEVMNDRASYSSAYTSCQQRFRTDIVDCDRTCVMTHSPPPYCQACHIIPHSRGDEVSPNISSVIPNLF